MPHFICAVCGTQYADRDTPPDPCAICADERQYLAVRDPQWLTHERLRASHKNAVREIGSGLLGIGIEPAFAIGQRAVLLLRPEGNVLWDCVPLLDPGLARLLHAAGGLAAIAISHPHYYSAMAVWAAAFDAPVYLHEADRAWVMRDSPHLRFWSGERHVLTDSLTLVRTGGHFAGGTVLHEAADGGTLFSGDLLQVTPDGWVSFMYSYPNLLPLPADTVERMVGALDGLAYERVYGAFWGRVVPSEGQRVVAASAERYRQALSGGSGTRRDALQTS